MGKMVSGFCLKKFKPQIRIKSPTILSKPDETTEMNGEATPKLGSGVSRRIMVVVDSSSEAKNALLWTLSHCVEKQDNIVLLHVSRPSKQGGDDEASKRRASKAVSGVLDPLKKLCQAKKPEVKVEMVSVEAGDKGAAIVNEARKDGAGLLVLGQKKQWVTWRLMMMWAGKRVVGDGVVEYCINNAHCTAVAVRKKSSKVGGYIISTKRHRRFWLLA